MTGETIVDPATLADDLADVARTGIATEHDEAVLGESSLAAPVFDATGAAVGALALVLQSSEWPPPAGLHDDVREAARNISRELGAARLARVPNSTATRQPAPSRFISAANRVDPGLNLQIRPTDRTGSPWSSLMAALRHRLGAPRSARCAEGTALGGAKRSDP